MPAKAGIHVFLLSVLLALTLAARAQAASIPFVGCPTDADWGNVTPTGQPITVNIPDNIAAKLAFYGGVNNLGVLAPRGWKCSGAQAVGGNGISIFPPHGSADKDSFIIISFDTDDTGGTALLGQYPRYFPKIINMKDAITYASARDESVNQYIFKKYAADKLTYISDSAFEFVTPAHVLGLGDVLLEDQTIQPFSSTVYGVVGISFVDGTNLLTLLMSLPPKISYLHNYIDHFAEGCYLANSACQLQIDDPTSPGD